MCTVHSVKPHEVIEVLGGFKLLYPIFEKSLHSNLSSQNKADIWKHLFKVLRTFLNTDAAHVIRIFKNKHLIESLKSCIIRAGKANLITRDLLVEIINVARDVHSNPLGDVLEEFYKEYVMKIILDDTICDLNYVDRGKQRYGKVFEEVVENMV